MSDDTATGSKVRLILWAAALVLSGFSVVLLVGNLNALDRAAALSETAAASGARNYRHYVHEYTVTRDELTVAEKKVVALTQELDETGRELETTRTDLASVQEVNDQLKATIKMLERFKAKSRRKNDALERMILAFKHKSRALDRELQGVRKELAVFQPEISGLDEGRSKVGIFRDRIRAIRRNMGSIRHQAAEARAAAQQERDRLESLYGNGGFLVRDGVARSTSLFDQRKVEIDVNFLNK